MRAHRAPADVWVAASTASLSCSGVGNACTLLLRLRRVSWLDTAMKPRGRALTRAQKAGNRRIGRRRVRIEHVISSVKRCRVVHDINRLRKAGVRDLIMEACGGLHHFRV